MDTVIFPKAWWTSKTIIGVITSVIAQSYGLLATHYHWTAWNPSDADLVTNLFTIAGLALAGIGLRTATQPIGDPKAAITVPLTAVGTASGNAPAK